VLTIVWDVNSSILVHFEERSQNVTSARYNDMLVNELKTAIDRNAWNLSQKEYFCLMKTPAPIRLRIQWTDCSKI